MSGSKPPAPPCCTPCRLGCGAVVSLAIAWFCYFLVILAYHGITGHFPHREPPHYAITMLAVVIFWRWTCNEEQDGNGDAR